MGFDNECILNIQSLAGEYFCPVCRTLVYPNEALQSQCTHLYCKPCLAYVVSSTQACPYDGYLVTEAGSKPLTESNKALAETIGKIAVHCLYHRSGCTWQGSLSECTSHCSGCAFGNSPVVCNRCGVQIVHRQVQEHAQTCNVNGANAQTQPGMESVQDSTTSGAVVPSEQSKSATQQGVQASQSQAPQTVSAPPPGQNPNQQGIANPQSQAVAPSAAPTPEQWYQYQQYYQQYPGYDPYQQAFQQYYPYQPQAAQQFQQQPPLLQGQPQQAQAPGQAQPQPQPQVQPQAQAQLPSHTQAQPQNVPHGHPQPQLYAPALMASQNQSQAQPNQPQHLHPAVQPHPQVQSQTHLPPPPPPHGLIPPQPYSQAPPHSGQTHPQQHMQGPQIQYQQAHAQMHHPQVGHLHPHPYAQGHPQAQYTSHAQSHPQTHPPQTNQPPTLNAQPQNHPSSIQSVTGQHSYPQPHGQQQMQQAPPQQQHMMHIQPSGGSLPPTQVQSQFPQPPAHVRPPPPHGFPSNQQPQALLPSSQGQASSIPLAQQQIHPNNQQPGPSVHQRPIMQPIQQQMPQQYVQQPQPFAGQVSTQNQVHPSHFTPQQPQLRPQGPPQAMQQHPLAYGQPQQTVAVPHGMQPNQSQNHMARPIMPNHGVQQFPQSTGALGVPPQVRPPQHNASQLSGNPNYVNTINNQLQTSSEQPFVQSGFLANSKVAERKGDQTSEKSVEQKEAGSPSQKPIEKDVIGVGADLADGKSGLGMKSVGNEHNPLSEGDDSYKHEETLIKDAASEGYQGKDASGDPLIRQRLNDGKESTFDHSPRGNSLQSSSVAGKDATGAPLKHAEKNVINASLQSSAEGGDKGPLAAPLVSIQNVIPQGNSQPLNGKDHLQHGPGGDESAGFQGKGFEQSSHPAQFADHGIRQLPPMPFGPSGHQHRPTVPSMSQTGIPSNGQVPGHLPLGPLGPRLMPQPGQVLNPPEYLQPPAPKQPGPFHPDITLGGVPEAGSTASYGRGPSQFGNTQRSVELQYGAPLGQYNQGPIPSSHSGLSRMSQGEPVGPPMSAVHPGSFESQDRMIGRAPMLRGPEGQIGPPRPIAPMEGDFHNHRPPHFDGRRSDSHVPGSLEKGPFGQPFGSESNLMGMNGAAGGMRDERFKAVEDHSNPFPNRRLDQAEFHDSLKQPPRPSHMGSEASPKFGNNFLSSRPMDGGPQGLGVDGPSRGHDKGTPGFNYDTGRNVEPSASGAPGRFLPPYRPGALHPSDSGERVRAVGNYDDNRGRSDSGRLDFLGPAPGFKRHHMDGLPPRSPGREYLGNQSRPFGGFSGSIDDIDGRETHPFGDGSRSFNLPSDSVGHSIQESRFPVRPPGHMRRGEFDGPGNMRMGEHLRSGDLIGQEVLPSHLRRGELFNPRNLSGHPPLGEPGFGSFHGYGRITEAAGPGGFHHRPFGEPFGKSSHPRLGEPGFRSSYSLQGFPNDAGFYAGDSDSFDKLRKWKSVSTGWCRICKVDCETVEGLDMHSQTREHQKMTMDMVISIKQKNSKKQKTSNDHSAREEGSKSRNASFQGRGKKP